MSKTNTCATVCSIASIDTLLKGRNAISLDDVIALEIKTAGNLVVFSSLVVEGCAVNGRTATKSSLCRSVHLDSRVNLVSESRGVQWRIGDFVLGIAERSLVGSTVGI